MGKGVGRAPAGAWHGEQVHIILWHACICLCPCICMHVLRPHPYLSWGKLVEQLNQFFPAADTDGGNCRNERHDLVWVYLDQLGCNGPDQLYQVVWINVIECRHNLVHPVSVQYRNGGQQGVNQVGVNLQQQWAKVARRSKERACRLHCSTRKATSATTACHQGLTNNLAGVQCCRHDYAACTLFTTCHYLRQWFTQ